MKGDNPGTVPQRCAAGIPRIIPILGIPEEFPGFQRGGRISRVAGFVYLRLAQMRTRIIVNQRIVALALQWSC